MEQPVNVLNHVWRVSTRSGNNGACVEARYDSDRVHLRDSKNREGHHLAFTAEGWTQFVAGVKDGEFDRP